MTEFSLILGQNLFPEFSFILGQNLFPQIKQFKK